MKYKKASALYLSIIVLSILLSIVFGLGIILSNQFKTIRSAEKSVIALNAADAGIERVLVDIIHNNEDPESSYSLNLTNGANYNVQVVCCDPAIAGGNCLGNPCPSGLSINPNCNGFEYCVKSVGNYSGTTRALWVSI